MADLIKLAQPISGIDVSKWQGTINWQAVKNAGIMFALLRAGYGDTLNNPYQKDETFEYNYSQCKRVGMPVGIYWYSYATTTAMAVQEAKSCIAALKGKQLEYPVYYDVEELRIFNTGKTNEIIKAFADEMEKAGYWVGIYIYRSAAQYYLSERTKTRYAMAVAEYGPQLNYSYPYGVWQNSSTMRVNGINGNVDHDWCYYDYPTMIKERGKNGFTATKPVTTTPTTPTTKPTTNTSTKKSIDEIAKEVIAGKWGVYPERKTKLEAAGYDYNIVQKRVEELLKGTTTKKTVDELAREVIAGKWGVNPEREKKLTAAGYDAKAVQKRVNELMK